MKKKIKKFLNALQSFGSYAFISSINVWNDPNFVELQTKVYFQRF